MERDAIDRTAPVNDCVVAKDSKSKSRRIILVGPIAPPIGGMTRWTEIVGTELQRQGISYSTINTSPKSRVTERRSALARIFGSAANTAKSALRLIGMISGGGVSVHVSSSGGPALCRDILIALIAKTFQSSIHLHLHHGRLPAILSRPGLERVALEALIPLVDSLVLLDSASGAVAKTKWPRAFVEVIPNPVESVAPGCTPDLETPMVVYLGWVIPEKGIETLLTAWQTIVHDVPTWRLMLVGAISPTYRHSLETNYALDQMRILGELPHVEAMRILDAASILVLPSRSEGFPNVVLEAMARAKPVVATAVGAIPEMLSEGGGLLVPPKSAPDLAEALRSLMTSADERSKLGEQGRNRVERHYSAPIVVRAYLRHWGYDA